MMMASEEIRVVSFLYTEGKSLSTALSLLLTMVKKYPEVVVKED
jgi:hypothetical protein